MYMYIVMAALLLNLGYYSANINVTLFYSSQMDWKLMIGCLGLIVVTGSQLAISEG